MKWFKKACELSRLNNSFMGNTAKHEFDEWLKSGENPESLLNFQNLPDSLVKILPSCQPFVILDPLYKRVNPYLLIESSEYNNERFSDDDSEYSISARNYDAPFQTFSVELLVGNDLFDYSDRDNAFMRALPAKMLEDLPDSMAKVPCIIFHEVSPKRFIGMAVMFSSRKGYRDTSSLCLLTTAQIDSVLPQFIDLMNRQITGVDKKVEETKLRVNNVTIKQRINRVIYITGKKESQPCLKSGIKLDYSHRFIVRGHWRNIGEDKLGKNRAGDYVINGMTWVSEFEKGDKALPLIKKVRIIA